MLWQTTHAAEDRIQTVTDECHSKIIRCGNPFLTIEKTAAIIGRAAPEQKIFIVCRTPKDVRRLVEAGVALKEVNVGNMHFSEGKRAMTKKVYVDDEDMDDLKYLVSKGINVYAQDVPGDPKSAIE